MMRTTLFVASSRVTVDGDGADGGDGGDGGDTYAPPPAEVAISVTPSCIGGLAILGGSVILAGGAVVVGGALSGPLAPVVAGLLGALGGSLVAYETYAAAEACGVS